MSNKAIILLLISGGILITIGAGLFVLSGNTQVAKTQPQAPKPQVLHASTDPCNDEPMLDLAAATNTQIKKLADYQSACRSFVSSTLMTFTDMATTTAAAEASATDMARRLQEFAKFGITPLVIVEPRDAPGRNIDFAKLADGTYDSAIKAYFAKLKALGVTAAQMGIWNPVPEPNVPYWHNNQPQYFASIINRYSKIARSYYPDLQTSILFDSTSYDVNDVDWQHGKAKSLLPYVADITPGSVTYVGLQGFPWAAPRGFTTTIYDAADFLKPALLSEVADQLQTQNVWFNTGTFGTRYTRDPSQVVTVSPDQRWQTLTTVMSQVNKLTGDGYRVHMNLFAEDKSHGSEETNWSYWPVGKPFTSDATPVFTEFVHTLNQKNVDLWLFDS
jgi:hypothetical protein